jgi:tetratricopeptide (TPR) repeat protein
MKRFKNASAALKLRKLAAGCIYAGATASLLYLVPVATVGLNATLFTSVAFAAEEEEEGRRPPPTTRQSETLTRRVYERINEVMELRDMENYAEARLILDELKDMYSKQQLNNRETYTMFLFYANLDQVQENYESALVNYQEILKLPDQTPEVMEQTWMQVGSLYYVLERYEDAISAFNSYNEIALEPDDGVYLRIAYANYQLERYQDAIPPLLKNFELLRAKGEEIPKNSYGLLRALYLTLEDYPKAYQVVRESILIYGDPEDWVLLAQLSAQMEKFEDQTRLYYAAGEGGFLDSGSGYMTLASLLSNSENPYGCAEVVVEGIEAGLVEEDFNALNLAATCYAMAREDEKSVPWLEKAAELAEDGQTYISLARAQMTIGNYEAAIEAFQKGFEKGNLSRADQAYLLQARAYLELNRHDEGIAAARNAARDQRSADTAQTWVTHLTNEKERYETLQRQRTELAQFFRR